VNLRPHPYADLFPRIEGEEFVAFKDDIARNGLRTPIVLYGGLILDGRNRYKACIEAGVEPDFVEFEGTDEECREFVISENINRRHLTESQRALIAAKLIQGEGGFDAVQKVAKSMSIGTRTVTEAARVLNDEKADNVVPLIEQGKVSVHKGANYVRGRVTEDELLRDGRKGLGGPQKGNRQINKLHGALDRICELEGKEDEVIDCWTGDPDRIDQLKRAIKYLTKLSYNVNEDDGRVSA